jgi:DNA-binding LytR/AlgR family response regulator
MKIYYIEDNLFHQELFKKEHKKHKFLQNVAVHIFPSNQLETIYKELESYSFSASDFFVIDIELKTLHTGIDFAKKIRSFNPDCFIIFLSNDNTRGIEIINHQIRPDRYLSKLHLDEVFKTIEQTLLSQLKNQKQSSAIIELTGSGKTFLVDPDEVNYIETIPGTRSCLEFCGIHENFIIHDKMKNIKHKFEKYNYFNNLKSFSINPFNIKEVDKQTMEVIFKNDETLPLSSTSIKKLLSYIDHLE